MNWIITNLSWLVPGVFVFFGFVIRLIIIEEARKMTKRVHERVDSVSSEMGGARERIGMLEILRTEDKGRLDRFEDKIMKILEEMQKDIKKLLEGK